MLMELLRHNHPSSLGICWWGAFWSESRLCLLLLSSKLCQIDFELLCILASWISNHNSLPCLGPLFCWLIHLLLNFMRWLGFSVVDVPFPAVLFPGVLLLCNFRTVLWLLIRKLTPLHAWWFLIALESPHCWCLCRLSVWDKSVLLLCFFILVLTGAMRLSAVLIPCH